MSSTPFVIWYLLFMVPTYLLPALGSNSMLAAAVTGGLTLSPFVLHLLCGLALVVLASLRGARIEAPSLWVFAMLAGVFDFVPILSSIPLVPTVFHALALFKGGSSSPLDIAEVAPGSTQLEVRDDESVQAIATQSKWALFPAFVAEPLATYLFVRVLVSMGDATLNKVVDVLWPFAALLLIIEAAFAMLAYRKLVLFVSDQRVAGHALSSKLVKYSSKPVSLDFDKDATLTVSQPFTQALFKQHALTLSYIDSQGLPRQARLPWVSNGPEIAAAFERAKRQHKDLHARNLIKEAMSQAKTSGTSESIGATPTA